MQANYFSKNLRCGLRGLLSSAELGMRHGPRLWLEIGAAAGSLLPIVGTIAGAFVGLLVGGPLGVLMGLIGGAIQKRWGWSLGGALPGGVILVLVCSEPEKWLIPMAMIACFGGAIAGYRLSKALETSTDDYFERFQQSAKSNLARTPLPIRIGLCTLLLWTLADLCYNVIHWLSSLR